MRELSDLSNRTDGQPMFKLLDKVKKLEVEGKEIIHFEIGDPDFRTPENISNAIKKNGIKCKKIPALLAPIIAIPLIQKKKEVSPGKITT